MESIRYAEKEDVAYLQELDKHISADILQQKIRDKQIILSLTDDQIIGWIRYGYFWDNIPFMNLIFFTERNRSVGYGTKLVLHWENLMLSNGHKQVMTSTQVDEDAQFFYRKLGYKDAGCLLMDDQATELLFIKQLVVEK